MEKEQFNAWFTEAIDEWLNLQVADPVILDDDNDVLQAAVIFENIGAVIRAADDELEDWNYMMSAACAYSLMSALLDMAIAYDWLDDPDEWSQIVELFRSRSGELVVAEPGVDIAEIDISAPRLTSIADYIVRNWVLISGEYKRAKFTIDEKVYMIRSLLLGMRNSRYLAYDPWLKTLVSSLEEDWVLLGGGAGGPMTPGPRPWSGGRV
jgi:hypothetical protein